MWRVARPGGALTSHVSSFFASAAGAACAQTEVEQARVAARARAKRAMILSPFEIMCRAYGPGANMQVAAFEEGAGRLDGWLVARSKDNDREDEACRNMGSGCWISVVISRANIERTCWPFMGPERSVEGR